MSWFESWFDSKYYHILYQNRDDNEAKYFIDNLLDAFHFKKGARLLDLACGKGRHSIYLNSKVEVSSTVINAFVCVDSDSSSSLESPTLL